MPEDIAHPAADLREGKEGGNCCNNSKCRRRDYFADTTHSSENRPISLFGVIILFFFSVDRLTDHNGIINHNTEHDKKAKC